MNNPLLAYNALPPFSSLQPLHIEPAIRQIIADNQQVLDRLVNNEGEEPTWANLIQVLENLEDRLTSAWSTVSHLFYVSNSPELRDIYERCQPLITQYVTHLSQNEALYRRISRLRDESARHGLSQSEVKVLDDYLLDFRLSGVHLEGKEKERFIQLETRLNAWSTKFTNNVLDATHAWSQHLADAGALSGLPDTALETAADVAKQRGLEGYLLTLDFPCFNAVITYADDQHLREQIYTAYFGRASSRAEDNPQWNNEPVIDEILRLRREKADLLGFADYAELSLAKKMADNPRQVIDFLEQLVLRGRPLAEREFAALGEFAASRGAGHLNAWDVAYYSEKLRKELYDISQEELRAYFPATKVKQGLFEIASRLFGIQVKPNAGYDTWHPSVEAYDVLRGDTVVAHFFFDLFTRDGKKSGAWKSSCRSRRILDDGRVQLPAAYMVCNFTEGRGGKPALLTHTEVTTLFHEFGHGLHHLLTVEDRLRVSGSNGVAWDAVELPSQLLENWCWNRESIGLISSHYQSGEPLPGDMLEHMLAARNFQAGLKMMRQLEFGLFDFELHAGLKGLRPGYVRQTMDRVRARTSVFQVPAANRMEASFSHIFAGGYAAGYYSYYWAEVLSADVFSRFSEAGVFDRATGQGFLDRLLSRGGAAPAQQLFRDFMGREPSLEALLAQKGIPAS